MEKVAAVGSAGAYVEFLTVSLLQDFEMRLEEFFVLLYCWGRSMDSMLLFEAVANDKTAFFVQIVANYFKKTGCHYISLLMIEGISHCVMGLRLLAS